MSKKAVELKKDKYTIQANYSPEAIEKGLLKFITPSGDEFEISGEELSTVLIGIVNSETIEATFVDSERINIVEVGRQLKCVLDKDMKKGEVININYTHPYPIEHALIEEAWKIAQIKKDTKVTELTVDYINKVRDQITPEMENHLKKFYESFKSFKIK